MIDPTIFTIDIANFTLSLHWYGVLVMLGVAAAVWLTTVEFKRLGANPDYIWDCLIWVIPAGVIGARLWYVLNSILGESTKYILDPLSIINLKEGGLHFYGAILFGAIAFWIYAKQKKLDIWLMLDAVAPGLLFGQAIARPANFINQELYGPPTMLPWGIKIDALHRISPWTNLNLFPEDKTRFHPAFAYEMLWNFLAVGILLYIARKYKDKIKPGILFSAWLVLAGVGRQIIEFFRPDQPTLPGTGFSYSRLVALLMIIAGILIILIKYQIIKLKFIPAGRDNYILPKSFEEAKEKSA